MTIGFLRFGVMKTKIEISCRVVELLFFIAEENKMILAPYLFGY